jgi:ATP-dependent RNA helicase DDX19/DBP5
LHCREDSEKVAKALSDEGYDVSYLHGKLEPQQRDSLMQAFRDGRHKVLITTDVLSRGVDVESVTLVVNYHIPITVDERQRRTPDPETYVHRIGRTGRAGRRGIAITFVAGEADKTALREIERYYSPDEEMVRFSRHVCLCFGSF